MPNLFRGIPQPICEILGTGPFFHVANFELLHTQNIILNQGYITISIPRVLFGYTAYQRVFPLCILSYPFDGIVPILGLFIASLVIQPCSFSILKNYCYLGC